MVSVFGLCFPTLQYFSLNAVCASCVFCSCSVLSFQGRSTIGQICEVLPHIWLLLAVHVSGSIFHYGFGIQTFYCQMY